MLLSCRRFRGLRRLLSVCLAAMTWASPAPAAERTGTTGRAAGTQTGDATGGQAVGAGWAMTVPKGYRHTFEDAGSTLVLTPPEPDPFLIRLTYHPLTEYVKERPRVGREFIEHLAAKKSLSTFPVGGNGGIAYVEAPTTTEQDGGRIQETAGSLGLDDAYVTFTVVTDPSAMAEAALQDLLRSGLPVLLGRIRSVGP